jgi:hypothetical protein
MRDLERHLTVLEREANPAHCFECAMRELNALFGDGLLTEPCLHPHVDLASSIVELDKALASQGAHQ